MPKKNTPNGAPPKVALTLPTEKAIMKLPARLQLNLDRMDYDLFSKLISEDTSFDDKRKILDLIVVGGVGRYHFTLITKLQIAVIDQLTKALGVSTDEKKT